MYSRAGSSFSSLHSECHVDLENDLPPTRYECAVATVFDALKIILLGDLCRGLSLNKFDLVANADGGAGGPGESVLAEDRLIYVLFSLKGNHREQLP